MLVVEVVPQEMGDHPAQVYVNVLDPDTLRLLVRMAKAMQSLKPGLTMYGMEWSVYGIVELTWTESFDADFPSDETYYTEGLLLHDEDVLHNIDLQSMRIDPDGEIRFIGYWAGTADSFNTYDIPAMLLVEDNETCEEA
jgi:hypothetical protein